MDSVQSAFLFPGQGAQKVGMGKDFYENFAPGKEIFAQADSISGHNLTELILQGPQEELNQTAISQPAILTISYVTLMALREKTDWEGDCTAGLSLGEYTALIGAGVLDFESALRLVCKRGEFMQEACDKTEGTMASVLALEREKVEKAVTEARAAGIVNVANYNSPRQFVLSGEVTAVEKASDLCKEYGARRVIPLRVAGAYHSDLMKPAQDKLAPFIEDADFSSPQIPLVANATAREVVTPGEIKEALIAQVTSPVYWEDSMKLLVTKGLTKGWEVGPGSVLRGLMRDIDRSVKVKSIGELSQLAPGEK